MSVLNMRRHADDNEYFHRDFHASIDNAVAYIGDHFGEEGVKEYLAQYVKSRFRPMTLAQLNDYFVSIYRAEHFEDQLSTDLCSRSLKVSVARCPGISYFSDIGAAPSKWYKMTTSVLYDELAQLCGFDFKLDHYDELTGKTEFTFTKRGDQA